MLKKRIKLTIRKWQLYALHYSLSGGKKAPGGVIIVMLNNLIQQGGLLDRIKGIITAQAIADEIGYTLKVHVDEKTFNLFSFLQPVNPATVASDNDISYSIWQSRLVIIYNLVALTRQQVLHFFSNKKYQYHFYCNLDMLKQFYPGKTQNELNDVWRGGFNRLFKFDGYFVRYAQDVFKGETVICGIHLRFISLLGDFKEAVDNSLPPQQKQALINKCIEHTKKIIQGNAHKKYLVVADSITFLHALRDTIKMEDYAGNVVILDGPIAHIDFDHSGEVLQKTVLDFYLLSRCSMVYQVRAEGMYRSQFCRYAAVLGNAPYHEEKI